LLTAEVITTLHQLFPMCRTGTVDNAPRAGSED